MLIICTRPSGCWRWAASWGSLVAGQPTDDPAAYNLPEARTDFIFCVLGERLGLWGLALVLGLYAIIVWRGLAVASATREPFGRLVAVGRWRCWPSRR